MLRAAVPHTGRQLRDAVVRQSGSVAMAPCARTLAAWQRGSWQRGKAHVWCAWGPRMRAARPLHMHACAHDALPQVWDLVVVGSGIAGSALAFAQARVGSCVSAARPLQCRACLHGCTDSRMHGRCIRPAELRGRSPLLRAQVRNLRTYALGLEHGLSLLARPEQACRPTSAWMPSAPGMHWLRAGVLVPALRCPALRCPATGWAATGWGAAAAIIAGLLAPRPAPALASTPTHLHTR